VNISVIDDRSIAEIAKRGGKIVVESKETVEPDSASKT
jgi:hypothetical protein